MKKQTNGRRRWAIVTMAAVLWLGLLGAQRWELAHLDAALADAREHQVFLTQRHRFETLSYQSTLGMVRPRLTHAEIEAKLKSFLPYLKGEFFRDTALWQEFMAALKPEDIAFTLACMDQMPELRWRLSSLGGGLTWDLHRQLLQLWMKSDAAAALAYTTAIPSAEVRLDMLRVVLEAWARTNPADMVAWLEQQPAGALRDSEMMAYQVLPPEQQLALLQNVSATDPRMQAYFARMALQIESKSDPEGAAQKVLQMPAGHVREDAVGAVVANWSKQDPQAAVAWANALPLGRERDQSLSDALHIWASTDPASAATVAETLPQGSARDQSVEDVIQLWADKDNTAAGEWVQSLPTGPVRDDALGDYATIVAAQNPAQAATLTAGIGDDSERNLTITDVAKQWLKSDPDAAAAWLAQSGLPEARVQKLLKAAGAGKQAPN